MLNAITEFFLTIRWQDIVDVIIVSFLIYNILVWSQGNRSKQLLQGILIILVFYLVSNWLQLYTLYWLMEKITTIFLIAVIIVFQPELRQALEKIGRTSFLGVFFSDTQSSTSNYKHIIKAVFQLSEHKIGSLIVLHQNTGLSNITESGTELDATISADLIMSIFHGKNPLHDGAIVIKGNKILAAGCLLPLSESKLIEKRIGTRHRAALGLSEQSDSIIIITSEETGIISIAHNGKLTRYLTKESLEEYLFESYEELQDWSENISGIKNYFYTKKANPL